MSVGMHRLSQITSHITNTAIRTASPNMTDKTILLITGGNTGIGFETVKALLQSSTPYTILLGSRSLDKATEAIKKLEAEFPESKSDIEALQIDIVDDESIQKAFETVKSKYGQIDVLLNNAGAAFDYLMNDIPGTKGIREAWTKAYDVNTVSTQVITTTFMPLLLASSTPRLLFITSGLSSLDTASQGRISASQTSTPPPAGWPKPPGPLVLAYRSSKTALNMLMLDWHRVLQSDGVRVWAISPGFLATGLSPGGPEVMKKHGAGDPSEGAGLIRRVVEGERDGDVGKVVFKVGTQPW
ncbi:NAD(P)-binding protein [Amniculicola lignicola CBS 123094]|uniref:NAD(P)-binding protein n=1 Tax=Amniculicola lignicola CBS 123094 TaxID=1392246 RepID=A0A6A5WK87_9PLEO|nr:NAD(P)-binding protein [Amniculicola lignicola CBS 123094]